jgi:hypothetical protein
MGSVRATISLRHEGIHPDPRRFPSRINYFLLPFAAVYWFPAALVARRAGVSPLRARRPGALPAPGAQALPAPGAQALILLSDASPDFGRKLGRTCVGITEYTIPLQIM